jgi:glycosyltransferase involved in cell wall biosynthesis
MNPTKILIITNGPLCRNPRPLKEAETLGRAGYDVTLLTVRNHLPSEAQDREILRTAPFRRETVDMLPGFETPTAIVWPRRLRLWLARQVATRAGLATIHSLGPACILLRRAQQLPADLVIVHNEAAHWAGTRLLDQGRRVAADLEDWHSEDLLPQDRRHRPLALIRRVERTLLQRAVYTTTTSHALADAVHARYGGTRPQVVTNSFPLQPDPRTGPPGEPPAFFWFSQTLGPGRGLELFLSAWRQTKFPSRVVFLGESPAGYREKLLRLLPADRHRQVEFLPLVPPAGLPMVIARHDIGLALEQGFIANRNLTITNKIIQYLNAGLAVVASDTAGQQEVLAHAPDAGIVVEMHETSRFAAALDALLADRPALARRQQAARKLAEEIYCWEREAPRFMEIVARSLGGPRPH